MLWSTDIWNGYEEREFSAQFPNGDSTEWVAFHTLTESAGSTWISMGSWKRFDAFDIQDPDTYRGAQYGAYFDGSGFQEPGGALPKDLSATYEGIVYGLQWPDTTFFGGVELYLSPDQYGEYGISGYIGSDVIPSLELGRANLGNGRAWAGHVTSLEDRELEGTWSGSLSSDSNAEQAGGVFTVLSGGQATTGSFHAIGRHVDIPGESIVEISEPDPSNTPSLPMTEEEEE